MHPVNPNLQSEHFDQPMYAFSPTSSAHSSPRQQSQPPPTNPFAEYAPNPATYHHSSPPPHQQPQQQQYSFQQQPMSSSPPPTQHYQQYSHSQQPQSSYQPAYGQQPQPQAAARSPPSAAPAPYGGYPGSYASRGSPSTQQSSAPVIACPQCTYENPIDATVCEICSGKLPGAGRSTGGFAVAAVPMPQRSSWGQ